MFCNFIFIQTHRHPYCISYIVYILLFYEILYGDSLAHTQRTHDSTQKQDLRNTTRDRNTKHTHIYYL